MAKKLGATKLTDNVLVTSANLATEVTGTLGVANGGTGTGTYTNGQLLIGNTTGNTLTKATLTAGTGISITNGAGSITIAATSSSATTVTGTSGQLLRKDDRVIEPNSITSGYAQFGFTSFNNDNTSPWADYLHLRSYTDSSGGNDNLLVFSKGSIAMRLYQQSWNSATAYSTYKDVAFTDSNITGTAANITASSNTSLTSLANLTSVGTLSSLAVSGDLTVDTSTLKVDSANNRVGIGTGSPDVSLDIEAAAGTSTALVQLKNTSGFSASNIAQMQFWANNSFQGLEQIASIHGINPNAASNNGGALVFSTSANGTSTTPTERMRLDASGNLGVGTASPGARLDVSGTASVDIYRLRSNQSAPATTDAFIFRPADNTLAFGTNSAERARITSDGDVLINGAGWNGSRLCVTESSGSTAEINGTSNTASQSPLYVWNNVESGSTYFISFYSDGQLNARTLRGYINYRRDNGTLNLTAASDYRIKTLYGAYAKSGEVFDKITIHEGKMNGQTERMPMAVAHELAEAVPYAVEGEKDAVNEDGTPKLQMVSYTAMIPLMLAEIKSLRARVAELETL